LLEVVSYEEKEIINNFISIKNGTAIEFDSMSELLFNWVSKLIKV